jgi:hypothetical protein
MQFSFQTSPIKLEQKFTFLHIKTADREKVELSFDLSVNRFVKLSVPYFFEVVSEQDLR